MPLSLVLLHCCCWGCVGCGCCREVEYDMQGVAFFSSVSPLLPFLPSQFLPSAELWVSSTLSSSRACSAALLAARQIRRRPRAVHMCGPPSIRIHHAFRHHVRCLFDSPISSCNEFVFFFASTHSSCFVISSFPSCPSWASTSLSSSRSS